MRPSSALVLCVLLVLSGCMGAPSLDPPVDDPTAGDPPAADGPLVVRFLEVGQGDAILLTVPDGRHVLYDGGPSQARLMAHLEALGVEALELVLASHPHRDHIGGLVAAIREMAPPYVLDSGRAHTTVTYERYLEAIEAAGAGLLEPDPRTITLGSVELRVLPPPDEASWGLNDTSVGLEVRHGDFTLTLGGDAEEAQWSWWLVGGHLPQGPVQVHKASHHGSRNGDTREAMLRLRPEVVVIPTGVDNTYGHPHPEALALYAEVGASVWSTAEHGTVTVTAHADGTFEVEAASDR